jgi:hypothetical protein
MQKVVGSNPISRSEENPPLDVEQHAIDWMTLDDGHEALLVNGAELDGGRGTSFANAGEDVHAVGRCLRSPTRSAAS